MVVCAEALLPLAITAIFATGGPHNSSHAKWGEDTRKRDEKHWVERRREEATFVGEGEGVLIVMHSRSRMTIDPRTATMPAQSTSRFHRPDRHFLHQAHPVIRSFPFCRVKVLPAQKRSNSTARRGDHQKEKKGTIDVQLTQ